MNHIFYCHNNISKSIALEIISFSNLKTEDCVLLTKNITVNNVPVKSIEVNQFIPKTRFLFPITWFYLLSKVKKFKKELGCFIKRDYVFYSSGYSHWFHKFLRNHGGCREFCVLEEGSSSYFTKKEKIVFLRNGTNQTRLKLFQFLQLLNHGGYFYSSGIKAIKIIDSCRTVYAVHSNAYEHHNVVVLNSVFRPIDIVKKFDVVFAPSALNGGKSYKYVDVNSLLDSYKDLFEILEKKRYRNILLKFHPNQSALVKDFIRKESSKRTRLNFIEVVDVSIESICSSKRTIVISDMSSVLLYSAQLGSETYTINDLIVNRDQRYIEVLKHLPSKLIKTFKSISELPDNYKLHE